MSSVVFFGSGPVAAKSLVLLAKHQNIEAVITKPRLEHHKGEMPVLDVTAKLKIMTYTPANKKELSELFSKVTFSAQVGVVIDYGIIIASDVIDAFPLGIVNSHFSLLPRWRGADPITFAILAGDEKTGVSLMVIDEKLDTGKLITQKTIPIATTDTTPSLTDKLILLSDEILISYLSRYMSGEIKPHSQPHPDRATYSRKLTKTDGVIDWNKPAEKLEREIRAFTDWPGSRTTLAGKDIILTKVHIEPDESEAIPGEIHTVNQRILLVQTAKGSLCIEILKPAGKKEMTAQEFLAGHQLL